MVSHTQSLFAPLLSILTVQNTDIFSFSHLTVFSSETGRSHVYFDLYLPKSGSSSANLTACFEGWEAAFIGWFSGKKVVVRLLWFCQAYEDAAFIEPSFKATKETYLSYRLSQAEEEKFSFLCQE